MLQDTLYKPDSILSEPRSDTLVKVEAISFFSDHSPRGGIYPQEIKHQNNDWMFGVIFLGFIIYTFVHVFNRRRLNSVIKAFFAKRLVNHISREGNIMTEGMSVALFFIFLLTYSLLIYLVIGEFYNVGSIRYWGFLFYAQIFIGLLLFLFVKFLLIKISEIIFKTKELSSGYIVNYFVFVFFEGIALIPLLTLVLYLPENYSNKVLIGSGFLILLIFIYRLFRGLIIGLSSKKFKLFQLFLYFCTHEIIPVLVIVKLSKDFLV